METGLTPGWLANVDWHELEDAPYVLVAPLGRGGDAEVWRGFHGPTKTPVALKFFGGSLDWHRHAVLRRELRSSARLAHRHVARIHALGVAPPSYVRASSGRIQDGQPFVVMELLAGGSWAARRWPVPADRVMAWTRQLLSALAHAHARGVIHSDIKPSNVLLRSGGTEAVLADFGQASLDGQGGSAGSLAYRAPEQLVNFRTLSPSSDIYSLALSAFALIHGECPHIDSPRKRLFAKLPRLDSTVLRDDLQGWLGWCLEPSPDRRPPHAQAALRELERLLGPTLDELAPLDPRPHPTPLPNALGPGLVSPPAPVAHLQRRWQEMLRTGHSRRLQIAGLERALGLLHEVAIHFRELGFAVLGPVAADELDLRPAPPPQTSRERTDRERRSTLTGTVVASGPDVSAVLRRGVREPTLLLVDDLDHRPEALDLVDHAQQWGHAPIFVLAGARAPLPHLEQLAGHGEGELPPAHGAEFATPSGQVWTHLEAQAVRIAATLASVDTRARVESVAWAAACHGISDVERQGALERLLAERRAIELGDSRWMFRDPDDVQGILGGISASALRAYHSECADALDGLVGPRIRELAAHHRWHADGVAAADALLAAAAQLVRALEFSAALRVLAHLAEVELSPRQRARCAMSAASAHRRLGALEHAAREWEAALVHESALEAPERAELFAVGAGVALSRGDEARAIQLLVRARHQVKGDPDEHARYSLDLADASLRLGMSAGVARLIDEAAAAAARTHDGRALARVELLRARHLLEREALDEAEATLARLQGGPLEHTAGFGHQRETLYAELALRRGSYEHAARVLEAATQAHVTRGSQASLRSELMGAIAQVLDARVESAWESLLLLQQTFATRGRPAQVAQVELAMLAGDLADADWGAFDARLQRIQEHLERIPSWYGPLERFLVERLVAEDQTARAGRVQALFAAARAERT